MNLHEPLHLSPFLTLNHGLDHCGECKHFITLAWQQPQGAAYLEGISLRTLDIGVGVRHKLHLHFVCWLSQAIFQVSK
jgi:hypothetical protein